jgi:hypothetical protein
MGIEVPDPHLNMAFDRNTKPADKPANIGTDHAIEELTRQNKRLAIIHQIAKKSTWKCQSKRLLTVLLSLCAACCHMTC